MEMLRPLHQTPGCNPNSCQRRTRGCRVCEVRTHLPARRQPRDLVGKHTPHSNCYIFPILARNKLYNVLIHENLSNV